MWYFVAFIVLLEHQYKSDGAMLCKALPINKNVMSATAFDEHDEEIIDNIKKRHPLYNGNLDDIKSLNKLGETLFIDNALRTNHFINSLKQNFKFDIDFLSGNKIKQFIYKRDAALPQYFQNKFKHTKKFNKKRVYSSSIKKHNVTNKHFDNEGNVESFENVPVRTKHSKNKKGNTLMCETTETTCKTTVECTTPCEITTCETTVAECEEPTEQTMCESPTTECINEPTDCDQGFIEPKTKKRKQCCLKTTPACETEEEPECAEEVECAVTTQKCRTTEECEIASTMNNELHNFDDLSVKMNDY